MTVSYQRHNAIGVIEIDNPPVNALGHCVRSGLIEALEEGIADPQTQVLVLVANGRTFIAGADIREFGKPSKPPILPDVIRALENCPKPLIVALHGTALGGGLEVALACHYRVALEGTRVGLPEVKLGLLPGAGGTQRLPRLTGVELALDIITSGRFVNTDEALEASIIDSVSEAKTPLDAGLKAARDMLAGRITPRVTGQLPAPEANPKAILAAQEHLQRETPELFSPFRIVEAIEASSSARTLDEGLKRERELFMACMDSPQRAGLIHLFFAARSPHLVTGVKDITAFERVALVGEHPLFESLSNAASRANMTLLDAPDAHTELCLIAPNAGTETCPVDAVRITLQEASDDIPNVGLSLVLADRGVFHELVDHVDDPLTHQRAALTLKALRVNVVASRRHSILATLEAALENASDDAGRTVLEAASLGIAERGECFRPADIDLLAVEVLGYPRALGGPHRQATLTVQESP
ncbi:enoyl-CoA hydratase/isomerase family protein [Vreelandella malpeensis]|uniref:Enoyl-CoA hydratase/isomerase family protein n=1 Tax=Vreelandella malpeensis TaxID=1172368 RepID=A0ABS8DTZ0_9GAMM|nr:enoyl-CoA hydratase/isomerase family protein [Halomonas malpeensis]MCB8889788.1 enoyl-CoA hydratase/isomerase family protein [Halomonas malpeensis]